MSGLTLLGGVKVKQHHAASGLNFSPFELIWMDEAQVESSRLG